MSRILVTGATSFVGRPCVDRLAAKGHEVHGIARRAGEDRRVTWHEADLLEAGIPRRLVERIDPTHLLHLAWHAEPGSFWTSSANVEWARASLELIAAMGGKRGRRIVGVGSCAEYRWGGVLVEDATPCEPASLYGACKHAVQQVLSAWSPLVGLSSAWARLFWLHGPHEHPARLVASIVSSLLRGAPAELAEGDLVRDYLHVDDAAQALALLVEGDFEGCVNVGSGRGVALADLAREAAGIVGRSDLLRIGSTPGSASRQAPIVVADVRRLEGIGWRP